MTTAAFFWLSLFCPEMTSGATFPMSATSVPDIHPIRGRMANLS